MVAESRLSLKTVGHTGEADCIRVKHVHDEWQWYVPHD